jgi:hypothetical protein
MTAKRRSLNAAMDISPAAAAFIRGGVEAAPASATKPVEIDPVESSKPITIESAVVQPQSSVVSPIQNEDRKISDPIELETVVESPSNDRKRGRSRSRGGDAPRQESALYGMANLLVPLTTRLSPSTATALKRAGLEQKLYGRNPSTVQEIAEIAIQNWLQENGYV